MTGGSRFAIAAVSLLMALGAARGAEEERKKGFLTDPAMIEEEPPARSQERLFPLWKKVARDHALPLPWSVSFVAYWQNQDYDIASAAVQVGPLPELELDVSGTDAKIDSKSMGLKAGLWILPFLNLHAGVGYVRTDADIFLRGVPVSITPSPPPNPGFDVVRGEKLLPLGFEGPYWNVGLTLVGGYKRWWGSLTASYAVASLDATAEAIGTNDFTTERLLPKFGYSFEGVSVWIGAAWMDEEMEKVGSLEVDGEFFGYDVLIKRADWTPVVGMHNIMGEHWDLTVEGGFGDRVSAMFTLGYRF